MSNIFQMSTCGACCEIFFEYTYIIQVWMIGCTHAKQIFSSWSSYCSCIHATLLSSSHGQDVFHQISEKLGIVAFHFYASCLLYLLDVSLGYGLYLKFITQ